MPRRAGSRRRSRCRARGRSPAAAGGGSPASAPSTRRTARGSRPARSRPSPTGRGRRRTRGPRRAARRRGCSVRRRGREDVEELPHQRQRQGVAPLRPVQRDGAHAGRVGDQEGWRADGDHGRILAWGTRRCVRCGRMRPSDRRALSTRPSRESSPASRMQRAVTCMRPPAPRRALGAAAPRTRPRPAGGAPRRAGGGRRGVRRRRAPRRPPSLAGRLVLRPAGRERRVEVELRLLGADGVTRWVRDTYLARPDGPGALLVDGVALDITRERASAEEAEEAYAMLRAAAARSAPTCT